MFAIARPTSFRSSTVCADCQHRTAHMFCNLDQAALAHFDSIGVHTVLAKGVKIFEEEAPIRGVFVVCSGRVKLSCTSKQGKTLILRIAVPGDVLGLGAVLSNSAYEVTAETVERVELKSIRKVDFLDFVQRYGDASMNAAQVVSSDYRVAFFDARRLALSVSAAGRLASVMLDWGRAAIHDKQADTSKMRFTMALTHEELASLIGSSRETVTRLLGRFKKEKLIQVRGATIVILEPEKLEQLAV